MIDRPCHIALSNKPRCKRVRRLPKVDAEYDKYGDGKVHIVNKIDIFPIWLSQRKDFRTVFGHTDVCEDQLVRALQVDCDHRTISDLQLIAQYFADNSFLAPLGPKVLFDLAKTVVYQQVSSVHMSQGL
jgi:hypothetical protein